ncbi:restriction endonuclease subunit S [Enterococcus faecium]|uniref:restriction endonuclease subunit S n=1 Tax=Enterococcus faecium TaxID=1352 RepID=UPI0001CF0413|nr:restriction endonuclease subunit S [Enterococcus faecium]EFF60202.1 type I restriction modification DNA specificity domain protein [Enterococcus faecium PC4.1]EME8152982.1 restriction endonuclease subunit S [Enterococcus faecium]MCZ1506864.1 restriction endonuclease subunit S [Enterococcus faecium]
MSNDTQPEIRFPGFTDDWEQRKLGDSIKVMDGDRGSNYPHESDFIENGDTLFLDTGNVTKTGFKFDSVKYITKEKDEQLRAGKLEKNDLVLTSRGTLGNIGFYDELIYKLHPKVRINSAMLILRNTDEQLSYSYLHTLLKGRLISDFMRKNQVGSAQPHITKSEFLKLNLNVPYDIEEQKKIGTFFKQLDDTIALHQRKLDLLKETKKGFLQKMFPKNGAKVPEIRFPGFTGDWEERKLGGIGKTYTGLTGKSKEDFGHGDAKFVTYMNVFQNPKATLEQLENVEIDPRQNEVKKGDVFFTTSSETPEEVGMSSVWTHDINNIYLNSFTFAYRPTIKFDLDYLAFMLRSQSVRKKIIYLAQGISRYNISKTKMMDISVPIPVNFEEQQKIGAFFKQLDDTIALHQRKLDLLKETKKGFLQKMFV